MICDRIEMLIVFQWWSRALVSVSCLFRGCLRSWIVVLDPQLGLREGIVLHVFCECKCECEYEATWVRTTPQPPYQPKAGRIDTTILGVEEMCFLFKLKLLLRKHTIVKNVATILGNRQAWMMCFSIGRRAYHSQNVYYVWILQTMDKRDDKHPTRYCVLCCFRIVSQSSRPVVFSFSFLN